MADESRTTFRQSLRRAFLTLGLPIIGVALLSVIVVLLQDVIYGH
jgi:hypothetical protein